MHKVFPTPELYKHEALRRRDYKACQDATSCTESSMIPPFMCSHLCWGGLWVMRLPLSCPCSYKSPFTHNPVGTPN